MSIAASVLDAVRAESLLRGGGRVVDAWPECTACGSRDTEAAGSDQMELSFLELEET